MGLKVETKLVWNGDDALKLVDGALENSAKMAAENVRSTAERNYRGLRSAKNAPGELISYLDVKESKFSAAAYIVGIFADDAKPWEDSIGARGTFFEYGRSAKGKGRSKGQKGQSSKNRAQAPRPFLRPALYSTRRKFNSITAAEIKKALR